MSTARSSLTPAEDIAFGVIALAVSYALLGGRAEPLRERRRARREAKQERGAKSWPERMLGRGSSRVAFVVGVALTLPGASYLVALHRIAGLELSPVPTVLVVVGFCLVQMLLLEVPLLGYALAPERTEAAVVGFREWLARSGRRTAGTGAAIIGALLVLRGAIELLA